MKTHRGMLFSFFGDETLTKAQRAIGAVLILRTDSWRHFRTSKRPTNWEKVSILSGYGASTVKQVFDDLVGAGWIEELPEGGYQVTAARLEAAAQRHREHNERIKKLQRERRKIAETTLTDQVTTP